MHSVACKSATQSKYIDETETEKKQIPTTRCVNQVK